MHSESVLWKKCALKRIADCDRIEQLEEGKLELSFEDRAQNKQAIGEWRQCKKHPRVRKRRWEGPVVGESMGI